jgi:hypothetical protein
MRLYTKAMPILLGRESIKKIKVSLTDGDKRSFGAADHGWDI